MPRYLLMPLLVLLSLCLTTHAQTDDNTTEHAYIFTSFQGEGDGLHIATSNDARHWTPIHHNFLRPNVGAGLMRDPHITRGPQGLYHMVWTSGWSDKGIGYANSTDLIHWSNQRFLPLMAHNPGTRNCWAPELFYDDNAQQFIIYWSSSFKNPQTGETRPFRTWYTTTRDFETFRHPEMLFDPGFDNIDATMTRVDDHVALVFRQTGNQHNSGIYAATAPKPLGPYTLIPQPIVANPRAEGPALAHIDGNTILYIDSGNDHAITAYQTTDWNAWTDITDQTSAAPEQRQGSIISVPTERIAQLRSHAQQQKTAKAPEPILDGFRADPAIRVFGDTYYIYPTSDKPNWQTTDFSVWSSKNLIDWKNEGMILDVTKDLSWAKIRAWAPDCIERDGKYFFYFCAEAMIGVATADTPTGPFTDAIDRPLIQKGGPINVGQTIDPHAFIDDDGQAYLYYGNGNFAQVVKLNPDMISYEGDPVDLELKDFREGIVVFKRKGKYYFMWSIDDARSPDYRVGWGTSDSPLGPITVPNENFIVLRQNGPAVGTAHHSVVNVPGTDRWYACYHRHAIPDGNGFKRQVCLVRMTFDLQGNIVPMDPMQPAFPPGSEGEVILKP